MPDKKLRERSALLLALLTGLSACDPIYPPYLRNGFSSPILMKIDYTAGAKTEETLQPGQRLVWERPNDNVISISFTSDSRELYNLTRKDLDALVAGGSRNVTWNIEPGGIKPLGQKELRELEKK